MRKAPGNVYFITLSPAVFKHSLDFCSVCGVRLKIGVFLRAEGTKFTELMVGLVTFGNAATHLK